MRTPYPEARVDLAELRDTFDKWNAEVERARREYEAHPIAACGEPLCEDLALTDPGYCAEHACRTCRRRKRDLLHRLCWTCRHGGKEQAAERMRLRRRKAAR